jgi:hypothetical protein
MADPIQIIDTFPGFLATWAVNKDKPLEEQIDAWAAEYLARWPLLLELQVEDYASQGLDWRAIARQRIFPQIAGRLAEMEAAHDNLLQILEAVFTNARRLLRFDLDPLIVIHVGIGGGAGWVTDLGGSPAILFGLENIAECGWSDPESLRGLASHETGHLVQSSWRRKAGIPFGAGPWWQLYEEGFAQTCETIILGTDTLHQAETGARADWLDWCQEHTAWLSAEFLRSAQAGEPVNRFFGSWFEIEGRSETGYYLGWRVIHELQKQFTLQEIALLEPVEPHVRRILEKLGSSPDTSAPPIT